LTNEFQYNLDRSHFAIKPLVLVQYAATPGRLAQPPEPLGLYSRV